MSTKDAPGNRPCFKQAEAQQQRVPHTAPNGSDGVAARTLAVSVPFVAPDGQAVVLLPAVFIPGAGKLFAL